MCTCAAGAEGRPAGALLTGALLTGAAEEAVKSPDKMSRASPVPMVGW